MEYKKIQKEIFKTLQRGDRLYKYQISENEVAITDGFKALVLPTSIINFNLDKCEKCESLAKFLEDAQLQRLDLTSDLKLHGTTIIRKLSDRTLDLWINNDWLGYFNGATFYINCCEKSNKSHVKVFENNKLAAVLMPVALKDRED